MTATSTGTTFPQVTSVRSSASRHKAMRDYATVDNMLKEMALVLRLSRKLSAEVRSEEAAKLAVAPGLPLPLTCVGV